jgi:hypothetical protein
MKLKIVVVFSLICITACWRSNKSDVENMNESSSETVSNKDTMLTASVHTGKYRTVNVDGEESDPCPIEIDIKENGTFSITVDGVEKEQGQCKISSIEEYVLYLQFGKMGAMYYNDTIAIQNYGNAMNPYLFFELCDRKYIYFARLNVGKYCFLLEDALQNKEHNIFNDFSISKISEIFADDPLNKNNAVQYNDIGYYLEQAECYEEAIYVLRKVLEKYPDRVVAYLNIADAYWGINDTEEAGKSYRKYLELMKSQGKDLSRIPKRVHERIEK